MRVERREQRRRAEHVDAHRRDRVASRERRHSLRGEVHDRVGPRDAERGGERCEIEDVPTVHLHSVGYRREVRVRRVLMGDAVHDNTVRQEALGEMAAREAGDAGDQNGAGHLGRVLVRGGTRRARDDHRDHIGRATRRPSSRATGSAKSKRSIWHASSASRRGKWSGQPSLE